jgi:hypothetical protein
MCENSKVKGDESMYEQLKADFFSAKLGGNKACYPGVMKEVQNLPAFEQIQKRRH